MRIVNLTPHALFQFPYCAWEFKGGFRNTTIKVTVSIPILRVGVQALRIKIAQFKEVSIPILRVGVQQISGYTVGFTLTVSIPILRVGVQLAGMVTPAPFSVFQFPYCAWEFNAGICNAHFIKFLSHISADR